MLCVPCDIPASRKVGVVLAHSGRKGCNKCLVDFTSMFSSEADRNSILNVGPARENGIHREIVAEVLTASIRHDRGGTQLENGLHYSELLRLPYYKPIQFVVLGHLHNLFLATEHNRGLATVFTTFLIIAVTMNFDSVGVVYSTSSGMFTDTITKLSVLLLL